MIEFKRSEENPILMPLSENDWEAEAAFNGCPVRQWQKNSFPLPGGFITADNFRYTDEGIVHRACSK